MLFLCLFFLNVSRFFKFFCLTYKLLGKDGNSGQTGP